MKIYILVLLILASFIIGCNKIDNTDYNAETPDDTDSDVVFECSDGASRCFGDMVQMCSFRTWYDWDDCERHKEKCTVLSGTAQCYTPGDIIDTEPDSNYTKPDTEKPDTEKEPIITPPSSPHFLNGGGFFNNGKGWTGYAWASAEYESTISPEGFGEQYAEEAACVKGTVVSHFDGVNPQYDAVAMLGINIGQPAQNFDTDPVEGEDNVAVSPTGTGLFIKLEIREIGKYKICLGPGPEAENEFGNLYCKGSIGPSTFNEGTTIPWTDFRLYNWSTVACDNPEYVEGDCYTSYAKEPINQVIVLHEDNAMTKDEDFDFCLIDIYDAI